MCRAMDGFKAGVQMMPLLLPLMPVVLLIKLLPLMLLPIRP